MTLPLNPNTAGPAKQARMKFDLMDPASFEHIQRVAQMYANSPLFPEHLRQGSRETAIANAVLVMNIAERLGEDPLTVGQNIYFVSGKPGWSASYMISKANQHGVFKDPIDWEVTGEGDSLSVSAFGFLASTGRKVSATASMQTAKLENWVSNKKYKSMPEQMLRYRSATALIRLYCPEVMIGVPPANEVEDQSAADRGMRDITPQDDGDSTEAETKAIEPEPQAEKPKRTTRPRKKVDRTPPSPAIQPEDVAPEPEDAELVDEDAPETEQNGSDGAPQADNHDDPKQDWGGLLNAILADLSRGASIEGAMQFYGAKVDELNRENPDLVKKFIAETGNNLLAGR